MNDNTANIWPRIIFLVFILSLSALNCGELGGTETGNPTNPTSAPIEEEESSDDATTGDSNDDSDSDDSNTQSSDDDSDNDLEEDSNLSDFSPNVRVTLDPDTLACYEELQAADLEFRTGIILVGFSEMTSESQARDIAAAYGLELNENFEAIFAAYFNVTEGTEMAWVCLLNAEGDFDAFLDTIWYLD